MQKILETNIAHGISDFVCSVAGTNGLPNAGGLNCAWISQTDQKHEERVVHGHHKHEQHVQLGSS